MNKDWTTSKRSLVSLRKLRRVFDVSINENSEEDWSATLLTESGERFQFLPYGFKYVSESLTSDFISYDEIVEEYFQKDNQPRRWVAENFSGQIKTFSDAIKFERMYYDTLKIKLYSGEIVEIQGDFRIELSRLIQGVKS